MNKRIEELIKQSYFYDVPNDSTIFDREKFAELIVRECASRAETKLLKNLKLHQTHQMSYNEGLRAGVAAFKKHFGVKE